MAMALWGYSFSVQAITQLLNIDRSTLYRWVRADSKSATTIPTLKVREFLKYHEDICETLSEKDYKIAQEVLLNVRSFQKENEAFLALIEEQFQQEFQRDLTRFRTESQRRVKNEMPWLYDGIGEVEFLKLIIKKD